MIPKVKPFDAYKSYLGLKNHFTRSNYDWHKYAGKSKASVQAFYKRKDRFWFEKLSRQKNDQEVIDFFVANFSMSDDPGTLWIGEVIRNGESNYTEWKKRNQSLTYHFTEEVDKLFDGKNFDDVFKIDGSRHPEIVKKHLGKEVSLETLIILERILGFKKEFDKKLKDPVWQVLSMRMTKYNSFLKADIFKFKKILKDAVL